MRLPVLSCHFTAFCPMCYRAAASTALKKDRYILLEDSPSLSSLPLNCSLTAVMKAVRFSPFSFSVGRWIVIRMGRWSVDMVSSGSQSYLSRKAAWTMITSEEKAPHLLDCVLWTAPGHREMYCSHPWQSLQDIRLLRWSQLSGPRRCHGR